MTVYFVQAEITRRIKIGFTAGPVEKRLSSLQTGSGEILTLMAAVEGEKDLEAKLHAKFAADRTHNEWFEDSSELRGLIADLPASLDSLPNAAIEATFSPRIVREAMRKVALHKRISVPGLHPLKREFLLQAHNWPPPGRHGEILSRERYEQVGALHLEVVGKPQPSYDEVYDYMVADAVIKRQASLVRQPQRA